MWTYNILSRHLTLNNSLKGIGYSGHGVGLNNPFAQDLIGVGPIPAGPWLIGPWEDMHPHLGYCVAYLTPVNPLSVFNRSGFFIHGDNQSMNFTASDGCIILSKTLRKLMRNSLDINLTVEGR